MRQVTDRELFQRLIRRFCIVAVFLVSLSVCPCRSCWLLLLWPISRPNLLKLFTYPDVTFSLLGFTGEPFFPIFASDDLVGSRYAEVR